MSLQINKNFFFDRAAVIADLGKRAASAFAQYARWITRTASRSMRKGGKKKGAVSEAEQPPRYHNRLLRDHIYFDWDARRQSILMGPAKMSTKSGVSKIPRILERGGSSRARVGTPKVITVRKPGSKRGTKKTIYVNKSLRRVRIKKRPYMGPAVTKSKSHFAWPAGQSVPSVALHGKGN